MQKIKLSNGRIREVQDHLAFDTVLQKQQGFVPCDDNGIPLPNPVVQEKKRTPPANATAAEGNSTVIASKNGLTAEEAEKEILEAHRNGLSYVEIAKEQGVHWKKVEAVIKKTNS